ncbi:MAG: 50S ribosomal protein L14 [Candidatus Heimdallarchaeota archaeon]|nr:50S ribosomal protein L14 [Candidatus Heimdallarchaeota archaeon]RLI63125.1 MAG: 50S ribosomal protein L14 [Candidatus Gerdarchaeota archaeon]RLI71381.1 MAG: 50S ribosomal protein L14 [Candidatus Gerdarchaeota archaeon]
MSRRKVTGISLPRLSKGVSVGTRLTCADNTGAKVIEIIAVKGFKGRLNRYPTASIGDMVIVSVKKGTPQMRRQVLPAIVIRQRKMYRRPNGLWVQFEDNAAVISSPEGSPRGSEIRGPVAKEAAERWPRVAHAASTIV